MGKSIGAGRRKRGACWPWAVAILVVVAACSGRPKNQGVYVEEDVSRLTQAATAQPTDLGLLVLDTSISFRGFFKYGPQTDKPLVQIFLAQDLLTEFTAAGELNGVRMATAGSQLAAPGPIHNLRFISQFGGQSERDRYFAATNTRLGDVFSGVDYDAFDVIAVVTDGVQSIIPADATGPTRRSFPSCAVGSDYGCMMEAIKRHVLDPGYGLWLVAFRTEVTGFIRSEVLGLKGFPRDVRPVSGQRVFRPAFIWVVARDAKKGRGFVARVVGDLGTEAKRLQAADSAVVDEVKAVEFAPLNGCRVRVERNPKFQLGRQFRRLLVRDVKIGRPADDRRREVRQKLICVDGAGPRHLPWPVHYYLPPHRAGSGPSLALGPTPLVPKDAAPNEWLAYGPVAGAKNQDPHITVNCSALATAKDKKLDAVLTLEPRPSTDADAWWAQWSTEDDSAPENLDKTLYLSRVVEELRRAVLDRACEEVDYHVTASHE